ncbi:hypothetical protein, partial [Klebsiella pneumoniae]|uniref:hypothetical protein n=1 Tax=Klebsiella pneumoniae TaxID=573 RepID=UPI001CC21E27
WLYIYPGGSPIIESTLIVKHLIDNPGCRTAANNQLHMLSGQTPVVAEMFEGRQKVCPWSVYYPGLAI